MSMSREEAMQGEDDGRYPDLRDRRSISFPGKPGESPDDWPSFVPDSDERVPPQPDTGEQS